MTQDKDKPYLAVLAPRRGEFASALARARVALARRPRDDCEDAAGGPERPGPVRRLDAELPEVREVVIPVVKLHNSLISCCVWGY